MIPLLPTAPVALAECPTLSPARQLLWDAANYMERVGKSGPGQSGSGPNGEVCIAVAVAHVQQANRAFQHIGSQSVIDALRPHLPCHSVTQFSDYNDQSTVVAALRSAALT